MTAAEFASYATDTTIRAARDTFEWLPMGLLVSIVCALLGIVVLVYGYVEARRERKDKP